MATEAQIENRKLLAGITSTGMMLASIPTGYRKHKRTAGQRYRRRKHTRDLQRNAWRTYGELMKRAVT